MDYLCFSVAYDMYKYLLTSEMLMIGDEVIDQGVE